MRVSQQPPTTADNSPDELDPAAMFPDNFSSNHVITGVNSVIAFIVYPALIDPLYTEIVRVETVKPKKKKTFLSSPLGALLPLTAPDLCLHGQNRTSVL